MDGKEIYEEQLKKRDFSGSKSDEYAQLLQTLYFSVHDKLFLLLEQAERKNKKLSISNKAESNGFSIEAGGYSVDDIIFI